MINSLSFSANRFLLLKNVKPYRVEKVKEILENGVPHRPPQALSMTKNNKGKIVDLRFIDTTSNGENPPRFLQRYYEPGWEPHPMPTVITGPSKNGKHTHIACEEKQVDFLVKQLTTEEILRKDSMKRLERGEEVLYSNGPYVDAR